MDIFVILVIALYSACNAVKSDKTYKYFWKEVCEQTTKVGDTQFPTTVVRIVKTFLFILMQRTISNSITVGGKPYAITEYMFPEKWWELVKGRRVYTSNRAMLHKKGSPYYVFNMDIDEKDLLRPAEVEAFFLGFNENQKVEKKQIAIGAVNPDQFVEGTVIFDFKGLMMPDHRIGDVNPSGTVDELVAQIFGIKHFADSKIVYSYDAYDELGVATWLMSLEW